MTGKTRQIARTGIRWYYIGAIALALIGAGFVAGYWAATQAAASAINQMSRDINARILRTYGK